jgi:hypothetical protein
MRFFHPPSIPLPSYILDYKPEREGDYGNDNLKDFGEPQRDNA